MRYVEFREQVVPLQVKSPKFVAASSDGEILVPRVVVRALPDIVRPVPSKLFIDEPLMIRLVVEAVVNEA